MGATLSSTSLPQAPSQTPSSEQPPSLANTSAALPRGRDVWYCVETSADGSQQLWRHPRDAPDTWVPISKAPAARMMQLSRVLQEHEDPHAAKLAKDKNAKSHAAKRADDEEWRKRERQKDARAKALRRANDPEWRERERKATAERESKRRQPWTAVAGLEKQKRAALQRQLVSDASSDADVPFNGADLPLVSLLAMTWACEWPACVLGKALETRLEVRKIPHEHLTSLDEKSLNFFMGRIGRSHEELCGLLSAAAPVQYVEVDMPVSLQMGHVPFGSLDDRNFVMNLADHAAAYAAYVEAQNDAHARDIMGPLLRASFSTAFFEARTEACKAAAENGAENGAEDAAESEAGEPYPGEEGLQKLQDEVRVQSHASLIVPQCPLSF